MIKKLSYYIIIAVLVTYISGCADHIKQQPMLVKKAKPQSDHLEMSLQRVPNVPLMSSITSKPNSFIDPYSQTLNNKSHIRYYNWNDIMHSMINKMLQIQDITVNCNLLLVYSINNRTNGLLNVEEATETLRNILLGNNKFALVSSQQILVAQHKLGLFPKDNLRLRIKAIAIARNIGAQYVLYSNIIGNVNAPSLQMQLILVHTGEIVWSEQDLIKQL